MRRSRAASTTGAPATCIPSRTKVLPTAPWCSPPGDIIVLPYCRYVQDEVRLDIRDGFIRKIEGGLDAKLMNDWLEGNKARADDLDGHAISHLGWGLNPQGRWDAIALHGADPKRHHAG